MMGSDAVPPGTRFALLASVAIDRRTHESDVMERVLGLDAHRDEDEVRTYLIDLAIQPWLAFNAVSAVELSVGRLPVRRGRTKSRR